MFVFIVPLKSPARTESWQRLSAVCDRTLRSICSQTLQKFRVIIVCNQRPDVTLNHSAIEYVEVEDRPSDFGARDKWRKIKIGLIESQKYNPRFVMHCDADDCINRNLVEFSEHHPDASGWYFSKGWIWREASQWIFHRSADFQTICGTCRIMRFDDLKDHLHEEFPLFAHKETTIFGATLKPLPFKGAIYVLGHGENLYSHDSRIKKHQNRLPWLVRLKQTRHYRLVTNTIRQEFGLYNL
jgi:hypothetical protein